MNFFFNNRKGQTPLEQNMLEYLIPDHISDQKELYECELENMAEGIITLYSKNLDHLDYLTWLEIHNYLLGEVWTFAGKVRDNELQNPVFDSPYNILPNLRSLEADLRFWLEHNTFEDEEIMAKFHLNLLTIHPFKDGNGRWSRILTEFICKKESIPLPSWGQSIPDDEIKRETYINAINKGRSDDDLTELIEFIFS